MDSEGGAANQLAVDERPEGAPPRPEALSLRLRGITKRWGKLQVLEGLDLDVPPGERVWVGGRNGAGKTTLLRIACGLIIPDRGEVSVEGLDPERNRRDFQAHVGFLPAGNSGLYARISVANNLEFTAGIALLPRARRAQAIEATIASFGLEELRERRVDRLSMGQRQRVRLANTFLHEPRLILLDEPETSLDDEGVALLASALDEQVRRGGSALVSSPGNPGLELDGGYILEGGRLVAQ